MALSCEFCFFKAKCGVGGGSVCSAASLSAVAADLISQLIYHADVLTVYLPKHKELLQ